MTNLQDIKTMTVEEFLFPKENELTYGQKYAGFTFNPSKLKEVDLIKLLAAKMIDIVEQVYSESSEITREVNLIRAEAFTNILNAKMWSVESIIKSKGI